MGASLGGRDSEAFFKKRFQFPPAVGDRGSGLIELTIFLGQGGRDFYEEGNFVDIESFLG
jgi:hypothetical protein